MNHVRSRQQAMCLLVLASVTAIPLVNYPVQGLSLASGRVQDGSAAEDVKTLVQQIVTLQDPYRASERYRALFQKAGDGGIRTLELHPRDGVAIQAAWEEVRLTIAEKGVESAVRPDRHKLDWFLGFLEGRARLNPPKWWSEVVLDCRANRRDNIYFLLPEKPLYHKVGSDEDSIYAPLHTTLKMEGRQAVLRVGKQSTQIPVELLRKDDLGRLWCDVSALMTASRCFLAVHDSVGYPYDLVCIDRVTGKTLWKSAVFGTWWYGASGQHRMYVTIVEQGERVIVFGSAYTGAHVEAFRAEDGANLFRFSTSY
jgi:hypothetical protein